MKKTTNTYSPEMREHAVRIVLDGAGLHESRWSAILSISSKIGCAPKALNKWVPKAETDTGQRGGIPTEKAAKMKALEREVGELKQANETLRKGEAFERLYPCPPWRWMGRLCQRNGPCVWNDCYFSNL